MKVHIAIVLNEKTKEPKGIDVFKRKEDAEKYLTDNKSFNSVVERIVK